MLLKEKLWFKSQKKAILKKENADKLGRTKLAIDVIQEKFE